MNNELVAKRMIKTYGKRAADVAVEHASDYKRDTPRWEYWWQVAEAITTLQRTAKAVPS